MTTCLRCVGLGIAEQVTEYYARLGFDPWDEYANRRYTENARHMHEPERQTGRTTHGLLEAIAECVRDHHRSLGVKSVYLKYYAERFIAHLNLDIIVGLGRNGGQTMYEDHFHG